MTSPTTIDSAALAASVAKPLPVKLPFCRYGRKCTRRGCLYQHPQEKCNASGKDGKDGKDGNRPRHRYARGGRGRGDPRSPRPCKYGWKCRRKNCSFAHPQGRMMNVPCRDGHACSTPYCGFAHNPYQDERKKSSP